MRTTLELDEKLLEQVLKLSGAKTKKSAVHGRNGRIYQDEEARRAARYDRRLRARMTLDELAQTRDED
jgi:Arc/MetJ family transcription regulator